MTNICQQTQYHTAYSSQRCSTLLLNANDHAPVGQNLNPRGRELVEFTLSYLAPFDWRSMLTFLSYRSIPGVEHVTANSYARTIHYEGTEGDFSVVFEDGTNQVRAYLNYPDTHQLCHIIDRIKSIFDLRADSSLIDGHLAQDKLLQPMVKQFPGLRVPGCWDGFELAVRAILGQQVTVKAASTLVGRIADRYGRAYKCANSELTRVFPSAATVLRGKLNRMGIVNQRIAAIQSVAELVNEGELQIDSTTNTKAFVQLISEIKGIGAWTANYISMRALNDPNALPYSDLILRRAATSEEATGPLTGRQLLEISGSWVPWRSYAVILLWRNYQHSRQLIRQRVRQ